MRLWTIVGKDCLTVLFKGTWAPVGDLEYNKRIRQEDKRYVGRSTEKTFNSRYGKRLDKAPIYCVARLPDGSGELTLTEFYKHLEFFNSYFKPCLSDKIMLELEIEDKFALIGRELRDNEPKSLCRGNYDRFIKSVASTVEILIPDVRKRDIVSYKKFYKVSDFDGYRVETTVVNSQLEPNWDYPVYINRDKCIHALDGNRIIKVDIPTDSIDANDIQKAMNPPIEPEVKPQRKPTTVVNKRQAAAVEQEKSNDTPKSKVVQKPLPKQVEPQVEEVEETVVEEVEQVEQPKEKNITASDIRHSMHKASKKSFVREPLGTLNEEATSPAERMEVSEEPAEVQDIVEEVQDAESVEDVVEEASAVEEEHLETFICNIVYDEDIYNKLALFKSDGTYEPRNVPMSSEVLDFYNNITLIGYLDNGEFVKVNEKYEKIRIKGMTSQVVIQEANVEDAISYFMKVSKSQSGSN